MPIYYNGKIVAGSGGGSISGGVDIPASDTPPAEGNYWLDTSEEGEEYTGVNSFNGRTGAVTPQSGDYTAAMVGAVSGLLAKYVVKKRGYAQIIISGAAAHIVGSMIIKPIGLFQFYQWSVLFRIPLYLIIAPIEIIIICLLYKNSAFRKVMENA